MEDDSPGPSAVMQRPARIKHLWVIRNPEKLRTWLTT